MIVRSVFVVLAIILGSSMARAAPEVVVRSTGGNDPNHCGFWGDSKTLLVVDNGKQIARDDYCAAYGRSSAKLFTDRHGHMYAFVVYGHGHGMNTGGDMLKVMRVDVDKGSLYTVADVTLWTFDGFDSIWQNDYQIVETDSGGLEVVLHYAPGPHADEGGGPPEQQVSIRLGP